MAETNPEYDYLDKTGLSHFWAGVKTAIKPITQTIILTASRWSNNTYSYQFTDGSTSATVAFSTPDDGSREAYAEANVRFLTITDTGVGSFICDTTPTVDLKVKIAKWL